MSDEEKKAIEYLNKYCDTDLLYEQRHYNYIKMIIRLVGKQSKEIEELKEKNENLLDALNNSIDIRKYWISKSKIKAKIEEYDDKGMTVNLVNRSAGKTFQQAVHYEVKKVLQSLLDKE